ncbi:MAG: hypothetical protein M1546_02525, partial [Chloroflexi bacterium]|nr:hypothetical protein [Chloroflexota bacterium]
MPHYSPHRRASPAAQGTDDCGAADKEETDFRPAQGVNVTFKPAPKEGWEADGAATGPEFQPAPWPGGGFRR